MLASVYYMWKCLREFFSRRFHYFFLSALMTAFCGCSRTDKEVARVQLTADQIRQNNEKHLRVLLDKHCYDCHDEDMKEGDLDLVNMPMNFDDKKNYTKWVRVFERVESGEMPPKKKKPLPPETKESFKELVADSLISYDKEHSRDHGRSVLRRMNRFEYENTLRDILDAPWLQVKGMLPEDGESHHFNKDGSALQVSHVQMSAYLNAANFALRQVIADQAEKPQETTRKYYTRQQGAFHFFENSSRGSFPVLGHQGTPEFIDKNGNYNRPKNVPFTVGDKDPAKRELEAIAMVRSNYEPGEPKFNQFKAPRDGLYNLKFKTWSIWVHPKNANQWWKPNRREISKGRTQEPIAIYSERPPRQMRKLGSFNAFPDPGVQEMTVYLLKGETIRVDAVRFWRVRPPKPTRRNPLATKEGQPGVAFAWMEAKGPILEQWPTKGHNLLFDKMPINKNGNSFEVKSDKPQEEAKNLLKKFMTRVYRESHTEKELNDFLAIFNAATEKGNSFMDSMIMSYSAVLCSPKFLYLKEMPGKLNNTALASRISLFLQNSVPDDQLISLAKQGKLQNTEVLKSEVDRLLNKPQSQRFVNAFLDYWLDLKNLNLNTPDENLYNDYYLDDFLSESALDETRLFFTELIKNDLPVSNIIDSDFAMLNGRMATHYGIPGVKGAEFRKVMLPEDSVRGGLMTQASVLRVTANGTNTSPVMRGVWMNERILGTPPPPPPPSVPAVEPDTRGATTIREQLAKHREDKSCNACHAKIDPAGFALESFDIYGGFRTKYRALPEDGKKVTKVDGWGKNGLPFAFFEAQPVDCSGELPDGQKFKDIREFKAILLKDPRQIARNMVNQFITYATGAAPRFGDREVIESILNKAEANNFGVKTLIKEIVVSKLFLNK